ncbi:MAG: 30S ribosome-binding factor RbfA [Clostridia bacterium]|nr:30S ribosome-binding factor RbfA [Clostridia bacterium]
MNHRQQRVDDSVAHTLNEAIREVKDPRIAGAFVTVNAARVTPDLKYAKVYFGTILGDPASVEEGLKHAAGHLRSVLAHRLNLRQTPELIFIHDTSAAHGAHIAEVLKELNVHGTENDGTGSDRDPSDRSGI